MTDSANPKKHTATTNRGGGKAGLADLSGSEKGGHARYECPHCKVTAPDLKSMQTHHDARHPKIPFEEDKLVNLHANHVADSSKPHTDGRGSLKKYFSSKLEEIFFSSCFFFWVLDCKAHMVFFFFFFWGGYWGYVLYCCSMINGYRGF
ncbi:hypothetical protein FEM48_Zijuj02G0186700 [Ziziphus jujuba var. spinosa]|uniref:Uncharacterized protein n=1 Tax=Ziziphus jujuba var. spinosa TaxID=714518 RepID=A0A978VXB7_ZIZJJ|nr:hypothetical protein FEM48_Zijuj02G0186700 [Ziziphus jujuba var. spinosa]